MTTHWRLAGVLLVSCLTLTDTSLSAVPTGMVWDPGQTAPDSDAIKAAADRARAERCRTPSCQAIEAIDGVVKLADDVFYNERMNGYLAPPLDPRVIARRRLHRALLDRSDLYGPFCVTSARILHDVQPELDDIKVPLTLLLAGVDIDLRSHQHCAEAMIAAMPRSPAVDQVRRNAEFLCGNPGGGHPHPKAACDALVEGLTATR